MLFRQLAAHAAAILLAATISQAAPAGVPSFGKSDEGAVFVGGVLDGYKVTNGSLPLEATELWKKHLQRRDTPPTTVTGNVSCRPMTQADLNDLSDAQLTTFVNRLNALFYFPVYDLDQGSNNIRKYRYGALGDSTRKDQGISAWVGPMNAQNLADNPLLNTAQVCLDASKATVTQPYYEDPAQCSETKLTTQGTLSDQGQVTIQVMQGYTVSSTISTETSSTFGKSLSVNAGLTLGPLELGATGEVHYETSNTAGTESSKEQSSETTVTVQINPPAGYNCYMDLTQKNCPGTTTVTIPFVFSPNTYLLVNFDYLPLPNFLNPDSTVIPQSPIVQDGGSSTKMFYVDVATLLGDLPGLFLTNKVSTVVSTNGQYHQHCNANGAADPSSSSSGGGISTAYVPQLTCPKTLGVIQSACSHTLEDYIGNKAVTGDNSNWAANNVQIVQDPPVGTSISYGQSTLSFNVSTPYHWTECESQIQVVPPISNTFMPLDASVLTLPQDNSALTTRYSVGYVGQCNQSPDQQMHGSCTISNIQSLNTKDFKYSLTSSPGNPIEFFSFSGTWPEYDLFTFTITCSDAYGSTAVSQTFQEAYRGDIATAVVTANTATQTFHSTTKYLYTSVKTFLTSIYVPQTTATLKTDTLYTATRYTSTEFFTNFGAPGFKAKATSTKTSTSTVKKTKTLHPTVTPGTTTLHSTKIERPTSITTIHRTKGVKTVRATLTEPHTKLVTVTARPTQCARVAANTKNVIDARRIISTSTSTDLLNTATVTDYTNTAVVSLDATTTSTDYTDVYSTTSASTNTVYDPIHTAITSGIKKDVLTSILNSYTITKTSTRTRTTTTSTTRTKTSPTTVRKATFTSVSTKVEPKLLTTYQTKPSSTSTLYIKTVQGSKTVTRTTTKAAKCTP